MLSTTYELTDMKEELRPDYSYYDFDSQGEMDNALEYAITRVKREKMLNIIDSDTYDEIAALDRTGLDDTQEALYYAEVYYALGMFFEIKSNQEWYKRKGRTESRSEGKMSWTVDGKTGLEYLSDEYYGRAELYVSTTGYIPVSDSSAIIRRNQGLHSD